MQINNPAVALSSANLTEINGNTIQTGDGPDGNGVMRVTASAVQTGDSFAMGFGITSGAHTYVSAASNLNGIIVKRGSTLVCATSSGTGVVCVGATAPSNLTGNEAILLAASLGASSILGHDVFIPAGSGLFLYVDTSNAFDYAINYKVL